MMIRNLRQSLLNHLVAMYMTVSLMIINAQETLALWKRAFPAIIRSL